MKKTLLYGSIIMTAIYALALGAAVACQETYLSVFFNQRCDFVFPANEILVEVIVILAVLFMTVYFLKYPEKENTRGETFVIIANVLWLLCKNWFTMLLSIVNSMRYIAEGLGYLASYSALCRAIDICNPMLVFAQLSLIIYAGISLGEKGRLYENIKEN